METRPQPPANDGPLEVLIATEPHEERSLRPVGRFLLRHRRVSMSLLAIAIGLLVLFAWTLANGEEIHGKAIAVADGDTLTVLTSDKQQHRIRIAGIDAPEKGQPFGDRSRQNLAQLAYQKDAQLDCYKIDQYRRNVCRVFVEGRDVGLEQVRAGLAWWYRRYSKEQNALERRDYEHAETKARSTGVGLWRDGEPVPPWEWRRVRRERQR